VKEKIQAVREYLKHFPNDASARNNLLLCEYADELGIELSYHNRIQYGFFIINDQIQAGKKYCLTNSKTQYQQNGQDTLVIWRASCGRLEFVNNKYWFDIEAEWCDLMNVLKSYEPLDYDELNNTYLYDLEHGKKLINDYGKIIQDFEKKVDLKIKEVELANKKKELERLQKELGLL
jgi:hypothetical protein